MQSPKQLPKVTDDTEFPYGKAYKGTKMANVPAWFLLSQYEQGNLSKNFAEYVEENKAGLEVERANNNRFLSK